MSAPKSPWVFTKPEGERHMARRQNKQTLRARYEMREHRIKVAVDLDAEYRFQSSAKAWVWRAADLTWQGVSSLHHSECPAANYGSGDTPDRPALLKAERELLVRAAWALGATEPAKPITGMLPSMDEIKAAEPKPKPKRKRKAKGVKRVRLGKLEGGSARWGNCPEGEVQIDGEHVGDWSPWTEDANPCSYSSEQRVLGYSVSGCSWQGHEIEVEVELRGNYKLAAQAKAELKRRVYERLVEIERRVEAEASPQCWECATPMGEGTPHEIGGEDVEERVCDSCASKARGGAA